MEPPASLGALDLQAARETVINCFRPLDPAEVVLGQFDGYRDVPGIAAVASTQDTFVAARVWVHNDRWRGVPVDLRTGKRLAASEQQVSLILREPDGPLAGSAAGRQQRAVVLAGGQRRDRPVADRQEARARARRWTRRSPRSRCRTSRTQTRCRRMPG